MALPTPSEHTMKESIKFDKVADLYDFYVKVDFDIPFFLKETEPFTGEILELMCGTGRVSIPILASGKSMTCIDYAQAMLDALAKKIADKAYKANLLQMDVTELRLGKKFGLILLPFHSISEILSTELQIKALQAISQHLEDDGVFILTLQNPTTRLKVADGVARILGKYPLKGGNQLVITYVNRYSEKEQLVSGFQFFEIYDASNRFIEKRFLEINFKPISDSAFRAMITSTELEIIEMYGDYAYSAFDEKSSDFMVYKLRRRKG